MYKFTTHASNTCSINDYSPPDFRCRRFPVSSISGVVVAHRGNYSCVVRAAEKADKCSSFVCSVRGVVHPMVVGCRMDSDSDTWAAPYGRNKKTCIQTTLRTRMLQRIDWTYCTLENGWNCWRVQYHEAAQNKICIDRTCRHGRNIIWQEYNIGTVEHSNYRT